MSLADAVRLSVGTFSAVPTPAPRLVDRPTAGVAVAIAPLAVAPIGLIVGLVAWFAREMTLPSIVVGALAIGVGAMGTRGFHLDGLADTADALAASYDRDRALSVARTGDVGPAGAATIVLVLVIQTGAAGSLAVAFPWGPLALGGAWCLARAAATVGLRAGVPAARPDGLGATFAGSVRPLAVVAVWIGAGLVATAFAILLDLPLWHGPAAVAVTLMVVVAFVTHVTRRLGGIIGDSVGASVELAAAVLLLGLVAVAP